MADKERTLYIVAGANGTGKTTLAKELLKEKDLRFLNADELALKINPANIDKARIEAGRAFLKKLDSLLHGRACFALETTLSGHTISALIKRAKKDGYKIVIIYFFVDSPELAIDRIKLRVKKGGHHVPDEDVIRRFYRSKNNFWNTCRKIANEWAIFYNGEQRGLLVAGGDNKDIDVFEEELFILFKKDVKDDKKQL